MEQNGTPMTIQWYPGHMAKARRELAESLKLIDLVIELCDARAPLATRNPDFDDLFQTKTRVALLNKSDLADPASTKAWLRYFEERGILAAQMISTGQNARKIALPLIERAASPKVAAMKAKGVNKIVRCMVAGIPNVGKSTFINRLAGENRAKTGDRPGVTRSRQWVKITPYLELLDTPGLLWPKLTNETYARHLAYIGSIRDDIMDVERLAGLLLDELLTICPAAVSERYKKLTADTPAQERLLAVCDSRGFLLRGGERDTERAARIVLDEFRAGKLGRITLESLSFRKERDPKKTDGPSDAGSGEAPFMQNARDPKKTAGPSDTGSGEAPGLPKEKTTEKTEGGC